jgi:peptidoglycan/xylan/chitin deacetylase (PgdA/CDA1 family)
MWKMTFREKLYPVLSFASKFFSIEQLIEESEQLLFLPFYHTISDKSLPHVEQLYPIKNTTQFKQDLDFLLKYFKPVSIEDVLNHVQNKKLITEPSFHLTFDDGMRDCIEMIKPILKEKNIRASFFVNNDFVDNKELFYRHKISLIIHYLKNSDITNHQLKQVKDILINAQLYSISIIESLKSIKYTQQTILDSIAIILDIDFEQFLNSEKPYMTASEIKQLQADGFHIGAHSVDHPYYKDIDFDEQIRQTSESLKYVEQHFENDIRSFAFPFSSDMLSKDFFYKMNKQMDISFGTSGLKLDEFSNHLHRLPMEGTNYSALTLTRAAYFYYLIKRVLSKNNLIRK